MKTANYSKVRFIGYAIPTGPSQDQLILSTYTTGSYLAASDMAEDMRNRVAILKNAVDTAKKALPANEDTASVNNIFLAPEFYFHGNLGPYIYDSNSHDPVTQLMVLLTATFDAVNYPNWTFVFGTAITAKVENIHAVFHSSAVKMHKKLVRGLAESAEAEFGNARTVASNILSDAITDLRENPAIEVRDRALVFSNLLLDVPGKALATKQMTSEKYFLSNIDFLLFDRDHKNVVTEEMVGYPHVDLSNGDIKQHAFDKYAIFRQNYGAENVPPFVDMGVEICLDHDDARLRKNMDREPFPSKADGLHVQLIPSCGSAIVPACVAVNTSGFVFNCDGWCAIDGIPTPQYGEEGTFKFLFADYTAMENGIQYGAHTQLARVSKPAVGGDPNYHCAEFQVLDEKDAIAIVVPTPVLEQGSLNDYFAAGAGAVHIYGLNQPYELFS